MTLTVGAGRALGFRSPAQAVGKTIGGDRPRTIIGVVDAMRAFSPPDPNTATYYRYKREFKFGEVASVRFTGDPHDMLAAIRRVWLRMAPRDPFDAATAASRLPVSVPLKVSDASRNGRGGDVAGSYSSALARVYRVVRLRRAIRSRNMGI